MINFVSTGGRRPSGLFARLSASLAAATCGLLLAGCVFGDGPRGTVQVLRETPSPREIIVESGMPPPAACVIGVNQDPPSAETEQKPKCPAKDAVWLAGNWRYYSGTYVWIPGRWASPPKPHAVYVPPCWSVCNGNHMFTEGYWHF